MKKNKTKQIKIVKFDHPFESILQILYKDETSFFDDICLNNSFKIKKFLGSDWSIKDSGFIFYGPNNLDVVFSLINIEKTDFNRINKYLITHINGIKYNKLLNVLFSIIKNTTDNTTIIEFRIDYDTDDALDDLLEYIKIPFIQNIMTQIISKMNIIFNDKYNDKLIISHSFIIKKNYKDSFNFFYNWNNMAKSLKTDKVWKIITEDNEKNNQKYKDFYIIINEKIKINYHVISIEEIKDKKIEIVYNKITNSTPSLNNYIKFSFFKIENDVCFFLYETHLPINISSSIYDTVTYYVYYCNKKSKNYIENNIIG